MFSSSLCDIEITYMCDDKMTVWCMLHSAHFVFCVSLNLYYVVQLISTNNSMHTLRNTRAATH